MVLLSDGQKRGSFVLKPSLILVHCMVCELLPSAPSIESASCFGDFGDNVTTQLEFVQQLGRARTVLHRRVRIAGGANIDRREPPLARTC